MGPRRQPPRERREKLPEELGRAGAKVAVFKVYDTIERTLTADEIARLARTRPGGIVLHSPSAAEAVFRAAQPAPVGRWRREAALVAIGETTAADLPSSVPSGYLPRNSPRTPASSRRSPRAD